MSMQRVLHRRNDINCMSEEKEKEGSLALRTAFMNQSDNPRTT